MLGRPRWAIFADIMKIITRFIKEIFKDLRKTKRVRNYLLKCNLYLYFLMQQNFPISGEKMLMSAEARECLTWFMYLLDLIQARYCCANFHHCRNCVSNFREGTYLFPSPIRDQPQKCSSWIKLKLSFSKFSIGSALVN